MESLQRKRRKILLLFLLGVGIPSVALGYLALRGIRNELASQEQRRLSEHRALSALISDTLMREITLAEQAVTHVVAERDVTQETDLQLTLHEVSEREPVVEAAFYLDDLGAPRLPEADLLYWPDGSLASSSIPSWPRTARAHLQTGRQHEFRQQQYAAALMSYRSAFLAVADSVLQGEALVAIARVERKAGQSRAALASCERLASDYGRVRSSLGLPLGAVATLERGSLLLGIGDSLAALRAFMDLYEGLVERKWVLERAQYDFFSRQATDSIIRAMTWSATRDSQDAYRNTLEVFQAREAARRERTERLLLFQETAGEDLRARLVRDADRRLPMERHFRLEGGGQTYLVSLLAEADGGNRLWGILLNADALAAVVGQTLSAHLDPGTTDWVVKDRDGRKLLSPSERPMGPVTLSATLADNFPPWLIEFSQRPQSAYRRFFASSQSIYFFMFILIAGILVFGLVLTIRAVSHELELARLKSDFVSTVSHEFKSPLTSIRHLAEMLQAGSVPSEERRRRYYDVLVEQTSRLSSLVTNILDLARIEEGKKEFVFEPLDVGELVRDLVAATQQRVGHEGYVLATSAEASLPSVRADRNALSRAITNLLDNAMQYSREVKDIAVRVSAYDRHVVVAVEDHGAGIPGNEVEKVFDRFYRGGDALTRAVKGSGLGLALVKEIVEAHGGTVHVESTLGQGSTFTIRLPAMTERNDVQDPDHRG